MRRASAGGHLTSVHTKTFSHSEVGERYRPPVGQLGRQVRCISTRVWAAAVFAWACMCAFVPGAGQADGLRIVGGGASARQIQLNAQGDGTLAGTANLPLSNTTAKQVRVTVTYFPDRGQPPLTVGENTTPLSVPQRLVIAAHGSGMLTLNAHLSAQQPPSELNGTLIVQSFNTDPSTPNHERGGTKKAPDAAKTARGGGRSGSGGTEALVKNDPSAVGSVDVGLTGVLEIPTDVTFEPSEVTLQVTLIQGFDGAQGETEVVRVRGVGVARLVKTVGQLTAGRKAQPAATLLLADDAGDQTLVALSNLHQVGPGVAEVTVSTKKAAACTSGTVECGNGAPDPGSYSGTLTLTPAASNAPTLKVTVHSRVWFLIPLVLLIVGAIIGGLSPLLTETVRTRGELRDMLRSALTRYREHRPEDPSARAAWDLTRRLGDEQEWFSKRYRALPGDERVPAVWARIHDARSDHDFAEDERSVQEISTLIESWIAAEPLALHLIALRDNPPADLTDATWRSTQVRMDTERLTREVHDCSPAPDAKEAQAFVERMERQLRFHQQYLHVWERRRRLDELPVRPNEKDLHKEMWAQADLNAFDRKVAELPEAKRSAGDSAQLETELGDVLDAVEKLINAYEHQVEPADAALLMSGRTLIQCVGQLTQERRAPAQLAAELGVDLGAVRRLRSEIVQELPAGAAPPALPPDADGDGGRGAGDGENGSEVHSGFRRRLLDATDWTLFAVIAVVTAIGYMIPLYTSTWGAWEDWVAAFAAGVGGQFAIKWALMPALRSKRLPSAASAAGATQSGA